MKHLKLFEAFNSDKAIDFRIHIVDGEGEMEAGHYLFSTTDESGYDSVFGVFDLAGLKELEDAMNTQIIVEDLITKVQGMRIYGLSIEDKYGNFKVTRIDPNAKFLRLAYDEDLEWDVNWNKKDWEKDFDALGMSIYDLPDADTGVLKLKDMPFGSHLNRHHVAMGVAMLPSRTEGENSQNIPIVLNVCLFMDHHGDLRSGDPNSSVSDQIRKHFNEFGPGYDLEKIADLKDIQKYLPQIFDSKVPRGFLKLLNRLKSAQEDTSMSVERFKKEWNKLVEIDFDKAEKEAETSVIAMMPNIPPLKAKVDRDAYKKEYNEAMMRYTKASYQALKDHTEDVLLDMNNLINQYRGKIKDYSFAKEQEFIDYHRQAYERGAKGLPPPHWPADQKWPSGLL